MTKFYSSLLAIALAIPAMAQQIPNSGFEEGWGDCTPWTSGGNDKTQGTTPGSWTISNVIGMASLGATTVGEQVEGYNSEKAVKVFNKHNKMMESQKVPGYVTLGTTWSTSTVSFAPFGPENMDGGTFGGLEFTGRPEKITFMYKFERATENDQPANAIAYLWKGTYTQKDVPGEIQMSGPTKIDMVDRDRNILGLETSQGGEVTKSEDAELIAVGKTVITETTSEWVKGEIVFDYKSDATPEKINIIFAANDYFSSENITEDNALTVDDVQAVYPEEKQQYDGKLVVEMLGNTLTPEGGMDASVIITKTSETTCSFLLPNLNLSEMLALGDIKVDNVDMATENGKTTYTGEVKGLSLMDGLIVADVNVSGTSDAEGKIDMNIDVVWNGTNIKCTFNGALAGSGISSIVVDDANAPVEFFNLQGVRVSDPTPGLYIRRQGNNVSKVIIR